MTKNRTVAQLLRIEVYAWTRFVDSVSLSGFWHKTATIASFLLNYPSDQVIEE